MYALKSFPQPEQARIRLASAALWTLASAMLWTLAAMTPATGDDTELFVADTRRFPESRPNVLLILDTSGSLAGEVQTQGRFDTAVQYTGRCDPGRIYWRTGIGAPPRCSTERWFELAALTCRNSLDAFDAGNGSHTDRFARFDAAVDGRWERLDEGEKDGPVECEDDGGNHGGGADPLAVYARNGDAGRPWSADPRDEISWGQRPADRLYTVYDANYLNWYHGPRPVPRTRHYVLRDVATTLLTRIDGVNVGLMATNFDQGGSVLHPVEEIETARAALIDTVRGLTTGGWAPLGETLYEAGQYYAGRAVDYGEGHGSQFSAARSRDPNGDGARYASPMRLGCQKNFIVLLTGGVPAQDVDADARIAALPGFSDAVGPACDGTGDGACLDDMAAYLFAADLDPANPGKQNVVTYVVGFAADDPLLAATALRGGGTYFTTAEGASLQAALTNAVTSIRETQTAFTAATVPVDSFNRLRNGDELYLAMFRAAANAHWPGNIRKYRLRGSDGAILDARGLPAIDRLSGWFRPDSRSFWSAEADGGDVALGGAAARIPDPASRRVYTYLGEPRLTHPDNAVRRSNGLIDKALLGIGDPGDPGRDELIDFIRGSLSARVTRPGERPSRMGDPLHGKPVAITYGATTGNPDLSNQVIYAATNDGFLHAIDARTGVERWAFVPPEFLADQAILHANEATPDKRYGIDGTIRAHVDGGAYGNAHAYGDADAYGHADGESGADADGGAGGHGGGGAGPDSGGVIESGEGGRAYLFFGMRRGGSSYYGLDVTRPDVPRVLWRLDAGELPGLGQSWSTPVAARMRIRGAAQNARSLVLVFGGGYDPSQDRHDGSTDAQGNALYIIDAINGNLLWHAAPTGSDFKAEDMLYSIPADVRVIDLNTDGFANRFYAADMGGQVWRFDVFNGRPAGSLVSGGVIARLGGAPDTAPTAAESRRFYYTPDIAIARVGTRRFIHIGIGSGHRASPNSLATRDRFFALRDHAVYKPLAQSEYATMTPITDADLIDITDNLRRAIPFDSPGWRLDLNDGGWRGEKVLAESRTFNNRVFFTTFTPADEAQGSADDCQPAPGTNRLYVVNLFNGDPVRNFDRLGDDAQLTEADRFLEVPGSIPGEAVFLFPPPENPDCVGAECAPPPLACVGLTCLPTGFDNAPVRTYWRQESIQ